MLHLLINHGGIGRSLVGKIQLQGSTAAIEVPAGWQDRLARALDGLAFKDRSLRAWAAGGAAVSPTAEDHFGRLARLLELESDAEARQTLERLRDLSADAAERTGECLLGLIVVEESSGLGGRCLLTLAKRQRGTPLPWNRFEPGTPVLLSPAGGRSADGWRGVVCERGERTLSVAFNEPPDEARRADLSAGPVRRRSIATTAAVGPGAGADRGARPPGEPARSFARLGGAGVRSGNATCASRWRAQHSPARRRPLRAGRPRRGHRARSARHRQNDGRRRNHPSGNPARRARTGLCAEQPWGRQPAGTVARLR